MSKDTPAHINRRVAAIKDSTRGILFAGTPHRGSDKAKWLAAAIDVASFLRKDTSPVLVDTLARGNQTLEMLQQAFKSILQDFAVYTLIEEMPFPKIGMVRYSRTSTKQGANKVADCGKGLSTDWMARNRSAYPR